jgi:phthalate 4,5-dioxygenase oxygenase subunit
MLTVEENELLTRTDAGTPMGETMRRYWIPALHSWELPEPDCPPVRVQLLGERLIAFRDTQGRIGLLDEFCPHRRASLWLGRNEECGLRCVYHGWKFDVHGNCVDQMNEPQPFESKIRIAAYSTAELGGVIWAYMGPPAQTPPLPKFEWTQVPESHCVVTKVVQECNWLQALEGGIDSSHVSFLHSQELERDPLFQGAKANKYNLADLKPYFEVTPSDGGLYIGARRVAEGKHYWRVTQWVMPCFTMIPPRADHPQHGHFWVPINDENCWTWSYDYHPNRPLTATERQACLDGKGVHAAVIPGTYIPVQNKTNDYLIDREAQKRGETFSGVLGFAMQDGSLQESMGPIIDRTRENLVQTDYGIVMTRNRLRRAAIDLRDKGKMPPGRDPEHMKVRSISVVLDPELNYAEACKQDMVAEEGKVRATV